MKEHDKLRDWLFIVPAAGGRQEFYTTYAYETDMTFIMMDYFADGSHHPASSTVFSFYCGEPDENRVMKCIEKGPCHTVNF